MKRPALLIALAMALASCSGPAAKLGVNWDDWRPGDAHIHPLGHGDVDVPDVAGFAAEAKRIGLRWWFVTDHGPFLGCPTVGASEIVKCFVQKLYSFQIGHDRWMKAKELAEQASIATGQTIMMGQELGNSAVILGDRFFGGGHGHFVSYQQRDYISDPLPLPLHCGKDDCIPEVQRQGGFGFIAHPTRGASDWPDLEHVFDRYTQPEPLAGFELLDGKHRATSRDRRIWNDYLVRLKHVSVVGVGEVHYLELAEHNWGDRARTYAFVPNLRAPSTGYDAANGGQAVKDALKAGRMIATNGPVATMRVQGEDLGSTVDGAAGSSLQLDGYWKTALNASLHELLPVKLRFVFQYATQESKAIDKSFNVDLTPEMQKDGHWRGTLQLPADFSRGFVRLEATSAERLDADPRDIVKDTFEFGQPRTAFTNAIFLE